MIFYIYWLVYGTYSRVNLDNWSSIYGLGAPSSESNPRSNSRHGVEGVKSDRTVPGGAFNAMEMQSVPYIKQALRLIQIRLAPASFEKSQLIVKHNHRPS
jgi:hypothetical protein